MVIKLVIGNKNYSSWSLRAWLLLSAYDIPFEEVEIKLFTEHTRKELQEYTQAGKVPVLHDEDVIVWDSLAICEYVSEKYLGGQGWPSGPSERAQARSYSAEMHSGFFAIREKMPMNCRANNRQIDIDDKLEKEISRIDQIWSELREKNAAKGPWLFGEFSIVDCMFAPVVFRFFTYQVILSEAAEQYANTVLAQPKVQHWLEQSLESAELLEAFEVGL